MQQKHRIRHSTQPTQSAAVFHYNTQCKHRSSSNKIVQNIRNHTIGRVHWKYPREPQHKEQCLELCHKELRNLRETTLTSAQLQRALRQLEGQMAISAENQENNALAMAKQMLYHHHAPGWRETFAKVKEITAEQLQDVANEVFAPEKIYTLLYDWYLH